MSDEKLLQRVIDPSFSEGVDALLQGLKEVRSKLEEAAFSGSSPEASRNLERLVDGCVAWMDRLPAARPRLTPILQDALETWLISTSESGMAAEERAERLLAWLDANPHGAFYGIEVRFADAIDPDLRAELVRQSGERSQAAPPLVEGRQLCAARWRGLAHVLASESDRPADWFAVADREGDSSIQRTVWQALVEAAHGGLAASRAAAVALAGDESLESAWRERIVFLEDDLQRIAGKDHEAFEAVWSSVRSDATGPGFARLRRLAHHPDRSAALERAMARAEAGAGLVERVLLHAARGDGEKLAVAVQKLSDAELQKLPTFLVRDAALALRDSAPVAAGRLYIRVGMLAAEEVSLGGQSRAIEALEEARSCFDRAGEFRIWKEALGRLGEHFERNPLFGRVFKARFMGARPGAGPRGGRPTGGQPAIKPPPAAATGGDGAPDKPERPVRPTRPSPSVRHRSGQSAPAVFTRGGSPMKSISSGPQLPPKSVLPPSSPSRPLPDPDRHLEIDANEFADAPTSSVTRRALSRDKKGNTLVIRRRVEPQDDE